MRLKVTAALFALALPPTLVIAQAQTQTYTFDIPAQSLGSALRTFARVSHQQVTFEDGAVAGKHSVSIKGKYTAQEALERLLGVSGLAMHTGRSGLFIVHDSQQPATERSSASAPTSATEVRGEDRLAQAEHAVAAESSVENESPAFSPSGEAKSGNRMSSIEEVVVSAQKREERLIDVPISIVAVTGDELRQREITTFNDLMTAVPGLAVWDEGTERRIILRGVSNEFGNSSAVGLYVDEADVTSQVAAQPELSTYDLERVEVLRGPQGTLYGEGSAGGTIRFITKDPVLNAFSMTADSAALFTQGGAPGQRLNMMVNTPIVNDQLGVRVAGTFDHEGGWINQPAAGRRDINSQDLVDVRAKALWQPTRPFSATALFEIHRNHRGLNDGEDANGNYTQVFGMTTTPEMEESFDLYNVRLNYDVADVKLLSTTTYVDQYEHLTNFSYGLPLGGPPGEVPYFYIFFPIEDISTHNLNQELRLTSAGSGPWRWTLGGFYRRFDYSNDIPPWQYGQPGNVATYPVFDPRYLSKSWAAFAEVSFTPADRLTLTAGVRNYQERQNNTPAYTTIAQNGTFHSIDPRFVIEYKLAREANIYTSAAKGFRSGGFNIFGQPPYGPEDVWTYELGTKLGFFGNCVRIDAAGYYSDYTNYQIQGIALPPSPPSNIFRNAGDAYIKGAELSLTWKPSERWSLSANGDYLDTRFYRVTLTDTAYIVGDRLPLTPSYTFTTSLQRDFTLGRKPSYVRVDYSETGREQLRTRSSGPWYFSESDVIEMLNVEAGLQWSESLSFKLFAQNLRNDRGFINPDRIELFASRAQPRTAGIEFSVRFE